MPRLDLYSVDYANHQLHMRLKGEDTIGQAWIMAELVANLTPDTAAVRVYHGNLPVLETRSGVTQFGLWHCHYEEDS